jgi:hypothetical protein
MDAQRRRALAVLGGVLLSLPFRRRAAAQDVEVPISVQIELLARVVKYDRNAAARMGASCNVLIVSREDDTTSSQAAAAARTELGKLDDIAGLPVSVWDHRWVDADTFVKRCTDAAVGVVLLTPGLSDDVASIATACDGKDLLTASLLATDVAVGVILGFTLESSRPTIVVNLGRARRQNVDFSARLLAIAKVIE